MADISKEMVVQLAREAFERWADSTQPSYWRTTAWARQAWIDFQTPFKLGRNAGLEEARAEAIHWQDLSNSHKCGFYIAAVIESLKDNTP